jgi:hypothetical protein
MRPLNRPMFRYGGPIKEGIMDGIREPKKNGGLSKQFNTGLVGDERYPKTDGRSHHVAFIPPIMAGLGIAGRLLARPFGQFVSKRVIPFATRVNYRPSSMASGPGGFERGKTLYKRGEVFEPNVIGQYFAKSPEAGLVKALISGSGKIAGPLKKVAVGGAKSPLTVGGLLYVGGSYFYPDGTPAKEEDIEKAVANAERVGTSGAPGGGDPGMYLTPRAKGDEGVTLSDKELRQQKIDRYRDIMDIKGMNKKAAYNSLIEASRLINESGDFKGDLKSGKLINQIIQGASKAFDKPAQTKDAIDTLILKGEIEKDIKASDPSSKIANELNLKRIQKLNKDLEGTSFAEAKIAASKTTSGQSGIDLAASVSSDNFKGNLITKTQLTDLMEKAKGAGEISEQDIIIAATTEVIKDKNLPDGDYTVGDVLVTITQGQVTDIKR